MSQFVHKLDREAAYFTLVKYKRGADPKEEDSHVSNTRAVVLIKSNELVFTVLDTLRTISTIFAHHRLECETLDDEWNVSKDTERKLVVIVVTHITDMKALEIVPLSCRLGSSTLLKLFHKLAEIRVGFNLLYVVKSIFIGLSNLALILCPHLKSDHAYFGAHCQS